MYYACFSFFRLFCKPAHNYYIVYHFKSPYKLLTIFNAIDQIVADKKTILIYPEAHIWPYYTKIRPFPSTSFRYPIKFNVPSFSITTTYQKVGKRKPNKYLTQKLLKNIDICNINILKVIYY